MDNDTNYVICWSESDKNHWEVVSGEDAMQERVNELYTQGMDIVLVFESNDEVDTKYPTGK